MEMSNSKIFSKNQMFQFLLAFIMTAFGVITAYYTTIAGIKLDLANKAENKMVNELDKRLSRIEVVLSDNFMTKDDFYKFKEEISMRLTRIEFKLNTKNNPQKNSIK